MLTLLIFICALGSGLMAGFFFAFSICVMRALARLPPAPAIAAMQSINVVVINPWFLGVFFGTAAACAAAVVTIAVRWAQPDALYVIAGSLLYLLGTIGVTMRFNVPRNNVLARLAPDGAEAAAVWVEYLKTWTAWNHVRTICPLAAAALFTMALWA